MSWLPSWLTGGVDLAAEEKRANELDDKLAALNADAHMRGVWTDEQYQTAEQNRLASLGDTDYTSQVVEAFKEGAIEGLQAEVDLAAGTIKTSLNAPWKFLWKAFPWWVWPVAGGVVVWYLGGFTYLRGVLAKR